MKYAWSKEKLDYLVDFLDMTGIRYLMELMQDEGDEEIIKDLYRYYWFRELSK